MEERKTGNSIRRRFLRSYLFIVLMIIAIGIIGLVNIHEVYRNGNDIYVNNLKSVDYLKSISQNVHEIDQYIVSMMSELGDGTYSEYEKKIQIIRQNTDYLMEEYDKLEISELEEQRFKQCRLSIMTYNKQVDNIMQGIADGRIKDAVKEYQQELVPVKACTYELIDAVVGLSADSAQNINRQNFVIYRSLIWIIIASMVFAVLIAVLVSLRMSRYFVNKLEAIRRFARRISEYNIADDIKVKESDEFGDVMEALNDSQIMIRDLVQKIIDESSTISDTGQEVSLAVRHAGQRIEAVNARLYKIAAGKEKRTEDTVREIQSELASVVTYLEQIGVTSDYQNELADEHREQIRKFKVREEK